MTYFTVHRTELFQVEAETADEAYEKIANSVIGIDIIADSVNYMVTDEDGEEVG